MKTEININASCRIRRDQIIEVYDSEGNQNILIIQKDEKLDGEYNERGFTFPSFLGAITLPLNEVFFLKWLNN